MRITNKIMQRNNLSNINTNKIYQDKLSNQMFTQKKINRPSDDPVVAIRALRLRSSVTEITQYYSKNIPDANSWLDVTEGALKNLADIVTNMISQCTKGANGDLTSTDRQIILEQLKALSDEVYSTGDVDYAGRYVFTGYRTDTSLSFQKAEKTKYEITEQLDSNAITQMTHVNTGNLLDWNTTNFKTHAYVGDAINGGLDSYVIALTGLGGPGNFNIAVDGKTVTVQVDNNTTVRDVLDQMKEAGLDAKFDIEESKFIIGGIDSDIRTNGSISSFGNAVLPALGLAGANEVAANLPEAIKTGTDEEAITSAEVYRFRLAYDDCCKGGVAGSYTGGETETGTDGTTVLNTMTGLQGIAATATINFKIVNGNTTQTVTVNGDDTIDDVLTALRNQGLDASFEDGKFVISGIEETQFRIEEDTADPNSASVLKALGLSAAGGANFEMPVSISFKEKDAVTGAYTDVTWGAGEIKMMHDYEDPYTYVAGDKNAIIYVPETGELLLGENRYGTLMATKDDPASVGENEGEIRIVYQKENWLKGDLRPEHYFYCRKNPGEENELKYNSSYLTGKPERQEIEYDVGFNQTIRVNSTADECFQHGIGREADDLVAAIEQVVNLEEVQKKIEETLEKAPAADREILQDQLDSVKKALELSKDKCQKLFERGITTFQGYLDDTNLCITNCGTRSSKLELIEYRMQSQKTTFETLKSENEDIDITETAIQLKAAELTYEAALMATGKVMQTTLLNFI